MIKYAFYNFEFGILKIGYVNNVVTYLRCARKIDDDNVPSSLADLAFSQIQEYLEGKRKDFDFPYELEGTEFQKKTWRALCDIPYGQTRSYKEIALAINDSKASRAVGLANGANPIWIVVPCHRVIGADGGLAGYAGGLAMKKTLLALEDRHKYQLREA